MIDPATTAAPATSTSALSTRANDLRSAAEAFEAVFLRQVIGSMRQAKLADDVFGSAATDQFRGMADAQLADNMAQQGSFGIAEMLLQQFSRGGGHGTAVTPGATPGGGPSSGGSQP